MDTAATPPDDLAALRAAFAGDTGAAAGWDAVRAFEAEHRVVLPDPYRTFVAEIADGAPAGPPDYGLLRLADLPDEWNDGQPSDRDLSRPFPLTSPWLWEEDTRPAEEIAPDIERVYDHGSIVLGTDGCGMYWHLVVTGRHRGHIWYITDVGAAPFGAEFGFTTAQSGFAGWVAHWTAGNPWYDTA